MCIAIMILILFTTDFLSHTENTALISLSFSEEDK